MSLACQDGKNADDLKKLLDADMVKFRKNLEKAEGVSEELTRSLTSPEFSVQKVHLTVTFTLTADNVKEVMRIGREGMPGLAGGTQNGQDRKPLVADAPLSNE